MKVKEWEAHVKDKAKEDMDLAYTIIALNEEAGEIAGWYKKAILRKNNVKTLTDKDLMREMGDCLYYLTRMAQIKGWTLKGLMAENIVKLAEREAKGYIQVV